MIVTIKHSPGLTFEQSAACFTTGQKLWWIQEADATGNFVPIGKHPATYPLNVTVNIMCGRYMLACGTGRGKLRRYFNVDLLGAVRYE